MILFYFIFCFYVVINYLYAVNGIIMVRKKRTEAHAGGESSEYHQSGGGGGRGPQQAPDRSAPLQQGGGGAYQGGGRGWAPQSQQGVARGGYGGGGRGRGAPQYQQYGGPSEYQGRGRGGPSQQAGHGGRGGNRGGPSSSGPSRPPQFPELHQATPAPYMSGVAPQPLPSEMSSSSQVPETSQLTQQFQQLSTQQEAASSQAIQPVAPSSKSVRFPLRPGKGTVGIRCIVKANHFFAELPDKDLHQYDVSLYLLFLCITIFLAFTMRLMNCSCHY